MAIRRLSGIVSPMLATLGSLPSGPGWEFEFKWDGVRAVIGCSGGQVQAWSRNDLDFTPSYPELQRLPKQLRDRKVVIDGELVALDPQGAPSFSLLQQRMHVRQPTTALLSRVPVLFYCFDLLALDGKPTLARSYADRRELLESLALEPGGPMLLSPRFAGPGNVVLDAAREHGLEGVVAKTSDSVYQPGRRSPAWIKVPIIQTQEAVIVGWRPGEGRRAGTVGSLLLGVYTSDGSLDFIGSVGTGFTHRMLDDLKRDLIAIEITTTPVTGRPVPAEYARGARWCNPTLVGEVQFKNWTPDATMRHPSWRGLRPDKSAGRVSGG